MAELDAGFCKLIIHTNLAESFSPSDLLLHMESISSMNMIARSFSRAIWECIKEVVSSSQKSKCMHPGIIQNSLKYHNQSCVPTSNKFLTSFSLSPCHFETRSLLLT